MHDRARVGLIDGWRGVAVSLVIIGHLIAYRLPIAAQRPLPELGLSLELIEGLAFRLLAPLGALGVQVFFVISGFLITSLLLREEAAVARVSIPAFYVRRVCRILPAFALYMLAVFALKAGDLIEIESDAFARSGAFLCNVSEFRCSWWLAHTWSLSVEEQFYVAWPLLFVFLRGARVQALVAILLSLVAGSLYYPQLTSFAHIAIGALTAASFTIHSAFKRLASSFVITAVAAALVLMPLLPGSLVLIHNAIHALSPLLTAIVFFGTITGAGPFVPIVRNRAVQMVGLASYSLYLWQQVGLAPEIWNGYRTGAGTLYGLLPIASALFILPAVASYLLIERPFIHLGRGISEALIARTALPNSRRPAVWDRPAP